MKSLVGLVGLIALILLSPTSLFAACVTPGQEVGRYVNPAVVYYSIDPSFNNVPSGTGAGAGATPQAQITQAFTAWNNANVGVTFKPASAGHPGTFIVNAVLTHNPGDRNTAVTGIPSGINPSTYPITTSFYPNNTFSGNIPLFSPSGTNYNSVYQEIMIHEIGHTLGLADLINDNPLNSNGVASSVEEQGSGTNLQIINFP